MIKIILPILVAYLIAYILNPIVNFVTKKIKNKTISLILVLLIFSLTVFLFLYYTIPIITKEIIILIEETIPFLKNLIYKYNLNNYNFIENFYTNNLEKVITYLSNNSVIFFKNIIYFITNALITIILAIYFLFKMDEIKLKIKKLFSQNNQIFTCLKNINNSLTAYLKSLFIILIIEFFEYTLLYFIIGHPNYLLLGLLASVANIIPFFGSLITNLVALITAISISENLFIMCSIIILILPIIDNYIIDPKIYQKTIKLNPIKTIISIIISSTLFGFLGMILAVPLYLVTDEIFKIYFKDRKKY